MVNSAAWQEWRDEKWDITKQIMNLYHVQGYNNLFQMSWTKKTFLTIKMNQDPNKNWDCTYDSWKAGPENWLNLSVRRIIIVYLYCCQLLSLSIPDLNFDIASSCAAFSFKANTRLLTSAFAFLMAAFSLSAFRISTAASPILSGSSTAPCSLINSVHNCILLAENEKNSEFSSESCLLL